MGVDLVSLGRHNLDVSSIEKTAQQLSKRLDINIAIGHWDDGKFFVEKQIERKPGAPFYRLHDASYSSDICYDFDPPEEMIEKRLGDICFMEIYREAVYIDFWAVSWRWKWYWAPFGDEEDKGCLEDINRFRRVAKEYYGKLGASYIYCYADQGPSDLIGEYEDGTWEYFENAIRTGKYLDDNKEHLDKEWPGFTSKDLVIFNVPNFLLGKSVEPSHSWWDVFYDDFADLDDHFSSGIDTN